METKYKLKKDARQFFDEKYHEKIQPLEYWNEITVHKNLLDEVERCYIDYGHEFGTRTDLSGWTSIGNKAEFRFTLNVTDINNTDYDKVNVAELMDEMQKVCNKYFKRV